ncbi:MAG: type II toxin-antitoxin system RelE/ParE family toxin [Clostridiales bacterium]|nr:type II toxin-antitoxin system RelE/ParE family toxin [Clostridiales bacterium]
MTKKYSKQALKFLQKQDKPTRQRLIEAIDNLPMGDVKKLQGRNGYRLRVGNYRIIFDKFGNILYSEIILTDYPLSAARHLSGFYRKNR